jgi:hypothetical protein
MDAEDCLTKMANTGLRSRDTHEQGSRWQGSGKFKYWLSLKWLYEAITTASFCK